MLGPVLSALVTAYCACFLCCGPWALGRHYGLTRSERYVEAGVTAACGPKFYGKVLWIERVGVRFCEDTGSAIRGTRIDVYVPNHEEALRFGVKRLRFRVLGDWRRKKEER